MLNGIQPKLNDIYGGTPHLDVDLVTSSGSFQSNASGMVDIRNSQTRLQECNQMLNTMLEARKLPGHSKKPLRDRMEAEETIENLVKLTHKEFKKEIDRRTGHE